MDMLSHKELCNLTVRSPLAETAKWLSELCLQIVGPYCGKDRIEAHGKFLDWWRASEDNLEDMMACFPDDPWKGFPTKAEWPWGFMDRFRRGEGRWTIGRPVERDHPSPEDHCDYVPRARIYRGQTPAEQIIGTQVINVVNTLADQACRNLADAAEEVLLARGPRLFGNKELAEAEAIGLLRARLDDYRNATSQPEQQVHFKKENADTFQKGSNDD